MDARPDAGRGPQHPAAGRVRADLGRRDPGRRRPGRDGAAGEGVLDRRVALVRQRSAGPPQGAEAFAAPGLVTGSAEEATTGARTTARQHGRPRPLAVRAPRAGRRPEPS
ncbi:hypothetical protein SGPA1_20383 [Streptomyces misionensis JCM 4497]